MLPRVIVALCSCWLFLAMPASACITWMPADFSYGRSEMTAKSDRNVASLVEDLLRGSPDKFMRITVYNRGASAPKLWDARIAAVRKRLIANGVRPDRIEVIGVPTNGFVSGRWIGRKPSMLVEIAKGCGG